MKTTGRDFLVYLAGPIAGLTYAGGQTWREEFSALLPQEIRGISPLRAKSVRLAREGVIVDSYEDNPLTSQRGITTRDRQDCTRADAVVFNFLGVNKVSIGSCMELGWADANRIPIVIVMESSGNVHDHCMVRDVAGFRVTSLEEAAQVIEAVLMPEGVGTPRMLEVPEPQRNPHPLFPAGPSPWNTPWTEQPPAPYKPLEITCSPSVPAVPSFPTIIGKH